MRWLAVLVALCVAVPAWAQSQQATPCGPTTIGTNAAAIVFPASGQHGNPFPQRYVHIVNPNASGTLWINYSGGTAAAAAAQSIPLLGQGNDITLPPVAGISIIGSTAGLAVTCSYQ